MTGEEYLSKLNNLWENINKDNIDEKKTRNKYTK